jgi:hypothetical protein
LLGHFAVGEKALEAVSVPTEPHKRLQPLGVDFESAYALEDVGGPGRLAELAVVHDIEADPELVRDDFGDVVGKFCLIYRIGPGRRRCACVDREARRAATRRWSNQFGRPNQAADMRRKDPPITSLHRSPPEIVRFLCGRSRLDLPARPRRTVSSVPVRSPSCGPVDKLAPGAPPGLEAGGSATPRPMLQKPERAGYLESWRR